MSNARQSRTSRNRVVRFPVERLAKTTPKLAEKRKKETRGSFEFVKFSGWRKEGRKPVCQQHALLTLPCTIWIRITPLSVDRGRKKVSQTRSISKYAPKSREVFQPKQLYLYKTISEQKLKPAKKKILPSLLIPFSPLAFGVSNRL